MTESELRSLQRGDIVRHHATGNVYLVIRNDGRAVVAIREIQISNPSEWVRVFRNELNASPLPLIIHCPKCHLQHVDVDDDSGNWATTRHHRKHLCKPEDGGCGHVWMPSLRNTVGVRELHPEVAA